MASAYLLSAAPSGPIQQPKAHLDLTQMLESAGADRFGVHEVAADPASADLVLFVETSAGAGPYFEHLRRHPVFDEFRPKSYLFCSTDRVVALLPGVYTSIERRHYREQWTRSAGYLGVKEESPLAHDLNASPSLLYSFVGTVAAHPVRRKVHELSGPDAVVIDGAAEPLAPARYAETIRDSRFVLCPRGGGTATFRLFEAMLVGRAPVIISDQWMPPKGPDWARFSIRIAESEVETIPALLESRAGDAEAMGAAARAAWLEWFSPQVAFHRTVESCLELSRFAPARAGLNRYRPYLQLLQPYHAARAVTRRSVRRRS